MSRVKREVTFPDGHTVSVMVNSDASRTDIISAANLKRGAKQVPEFEKEARRIRDADPVDLAMGSAPGRFATGASDLFIGAGQLGAHMLPFDAPQQFMDRVVNEREASIKRADEAYGREGFDWMRLLGNAVNPATLKIGGALAPETVGAKIGTGSLLGAGVGAATPVEGDSFGYNKALQIGSSALIGGLVPGGIEASKFVGKTGKHLLEPMFEKGKKAIKAREYLYAAGDKADDIVNALNRNGEIVPGSKPTAGEAAAPAGRAEFAALQDRIASHNPSAYLERGKQQQAARSASLGTIAKTEAELKSAIAKRKAQGFADYAATHDYPIAIQKADKTLSLKIGRPDSKVFQPGMVTRKQSSSPRTMFVDKELKELEGKPVFSQAMREVAKIAEDKGWSIKDQPARYLHTIKTYLDDVLNKGPQHPSSLGKTKADAVNDVREKLVDWLKTNVDGYETARTNFKSNSEIINRMQVGQELEKTLNQPISDVADVGSQRIAPWMNAQRDASSIIKKTGGDPRFGGLKDILTPSEMNRVDKITMDLARRAQYEEQVRAANSLGKGNIAAAQVKRETGGETLINPLHRGMMVINAVIRRAQGRAGEDIQNEMATEMLDPKLVADVMKKAMIPNKKIEAVVKLLNASQTPATVGAITNASRDPESTVRRGAGILELMMP